MKKTIAFLYGGVSLEHEVSVITGLQAMKHMEQTKYQVLPIYVDKAGKWWTGEAVSTNEFFKAGHNEHPEKYAEPFTITFGENTHGIDAAILCFHGGYGENGSVQGVLEMAEIPYQGPSVASSAVCFDKIFTRQVLTAEGISQPKYLWFTTEQYDVDAKTILQRIQSEIQYPCYVKAANSGSSIGVKRADSEKAFITALEELRLYDNRILIEAEVRDCIEVNISVMGTQQNMQVSASEQPIKSAELLSFADKYEKNGKGKKTGMASATRRIPAPISARFEEQLKEHAKRIFQVLNCEGVVRIDFFANPSTQAYTVTEINTIPGSLSFYLWEPETVKFRQLLELLVAIAEERQQIKTNRVTTFDNSLLKKL